ncbi:MAG TPA: hypothetical protein PLD93_05855 [Synergistaceae bacterium]|nr:hypothetical protein [Synergistaceae bacterium]
MLTERVWFVKISRFIALVMATYSTRASSFLIMDPENRTKSRGEVKV